MRKPKWYFCEHWRMNYYFFIGWKFEDYCKYILKNYEYSVSPDPRPIGQCLQLDKNSRSVIMVWIEDKSDVLSLAHECLHAANRALGRAGWMWDPWNDETQTYLMTNIMRQALGKGMKK